MQLFNRGAVSEMLSPNTVIGTFLHMRRHARCPVQQYNECVLAGLRGLPFRTVLSGGSGRGWAARWF
jgi:hypothetical protein